MKRETVFSPDRKYRYTLWRDWTDSVLEIEEREGNNSAKYVNFIGLNPSTADETKDDPTIRRCVRFAKTWGYGAMCMTNLFAFRATSPDDMMESKDPTGSDNDHFLKKISKDAGLVVTAWGRDGSFDGRGILVCEELRKTGVILYHLGLNADWTPRHPLYLSKETKPILYSI